MNCGSPNTCVPFVYVYDIVAIEPSERSIHWPGCGVDENTIFEPSADQSAIIAVRGAPGPCAETAMFDGTVLPVSGSTSASVPSTMVTIDSDWSSVGNGLPTGANVEYDECNV